MDAQRSDEIMASLREYLSSLPFAFQKASIISGQEEGLYGWVTVNYLMGNFLEVIHRHCCICSMQVKVHFYTREEKTRHMLHHTLTFHCTGRETCGTLTCAQRGDRL